MSKQEFHVQCRMRKGTAVTTSYIPEKFAVVGKAVQLKGDDDKWVDGWVVEQTYGRMESSYVNERSQDYKKTRKASDV